MAVLLGALIALLLLVVGAFSLYLCSEHGACEAGKRIGRGRIKVRF